MGVDELVKYLRLSVRVQDTDNMVENDSKYLEMSDEDLVLFLQVALTRNYPTLTLDSITPEVVYPLTLLAKKELYYTLAVKEAPLVDLTADNNNQIHRSQRFDHYMKLIGQIDAEYEDYLEDGGSGANTITSFDLITPYRYYTKRNYDKGIVPSVAVKVLKKTSNTIEIAWQHKESIFMNSKVYMSRQPIYDPTLDNGLRDKVNKNAQLIKKFTNSRQSALRVNGLIPDTTYYVCVVVTDMSLLKGYCEIEVTTEGLDILDTVSSITTVEIQGSDTLNITQGESE